MFLMNKLSIVFNYRNLTPNGCLICKPSPDTDSDPDSDQPDLCSENKNTDPVPDSEPDPKVTGALN